VDISLTTSIFIPLITQSQWFGFWILYYFYTLWM